MPSFLEYIEKEKALPKHLTFSLAALMAFYTGNEIKDSALIGNRDGAEYRILDDAAVLKFFAENSGKAEAEYAKAVLSNVDFWGQDLSLIEGLEQMIASYVSDIRTKGMRATMEDVFA